jgi:hypothetical protein
MRIVKPERIHQLNQVKSAKLTLLFAWKTYNINKRITVNPQSENEDYVELAKSLETWRIATIDYTNIKSKFKITE